MKKKKNKVLVIILALLILLSTGCTKYLTDGKKTRVVNETTGQAVTSNILCLPESKENIKIYKKYKKYLAVDYDKLSKCEDYKPSDLKYVGLWDGILIKPLAWLIIKIGMIVKNYGLSVMILGIIIRIFLIPSTKKTLKQSENMKKAQPELNRLQKKYENVTSQEERMQMSQEMMMIYKKYDISPAGGCVTSFIQLPIIIAFYEAINRIPVVFEGYFLGLQLGTTPFVGIKAGNIGYIVLVLLIIASTYFSYKNSMAGQTGATGQEGQMKMMMYTMIVFISIASLSLPSALALYWIVSNLFMIVQNIFIKKGNKKENIKVVKNKAKTKKIEEKGKSKNNTKKGKK